MDPRGRCSCCRAKFPTAPTVPPSTSHSASPAIVICCHLELRLILLCAWCVWCAWCGVRGVRGVRVVCVVCVVCVMCVVWCGVAQVPDTIGLVIERARHRRARGPAALVRSTQSHCYRVLVRSSSFCPPHMCSRARRYCDRCAALGIRSSFTAPTWACSGAVIGRLRQRSTAHVQGVRSH